LAKYNADKAAGLISGAKDIEMQKELGKEEIKSQYSSEVNDFYKLSNADKNAYFKKDPAKAKELYDQAKEMDSKLTGKGLTTTKFKATASSGGKKSGGSKKGKKIDYASIIKSTNASNLKYDKALRGILKRNKIKRKKATA
jgi:hypothetical protein